MQTLFLLFYTELLLLLCLKAAQLFTCQRWELGHCGDFGLWVGVGFKF